MSTSRLIKHGAMRFMPSAIRQAMKVYHYGRGIDRMRETPEPECAIVRRLVREGGNVVDVGANFGLYTHFLARSSVLAEEC